MSTRKTTLIYSLPIAVASLAVGMVLASRLDLTPSSAAQIVAAPPMNSAPITGPIDAQTFRTIAKAMSPSVVYIKTEMKARQDLVDFNGSDDLFRRFFGAPNAPRAMAASVSARGQALADALLEMRKGEVVVVLAYDRANPEAHIILDRARALRVPSILITDTLGLALAGQFTVALSARRAGGGMFHLSAITVVVLDALLFGLARRDRAGSLAAAEELQELRARIDERIGVAG